MKMVIFNHIYALLLAISVPFLWSCSTPSSKRPPGTNSWDYERINPYQVETIVILGLNDFHGALAPLKGKVPGREKDEFIEYEIAGASTLGGYVELLRSEFGSRLLILNAGDAWNGTLESENDSGGSVVRVFNELGVHASILGEADFDLQPDPLGTLNNNLKQSRFPYINSNVFDRETGRLLDLVNVQPNAMIEAGPIKVGVIGTLSVKATQKIEQSLSKNLFIQDLQSAVQREAEALRNEGAQLVILLAHSEVVCASHAGRSKGMSKRSERRSEIWKPDSRQGPCNSKSELTRLLNALPAGTLDGVVAGRKHRIVHHWINGVPVIQAGAKGQYFHLLYLSYDKENKKLVPHLTRIEGPVPICHQTFDYQQNCDGRRKPPAGRRGKLVPTVFHGKAVSKSSEVQDLLEETFKKNPVRKGKDSGHVQSEDFPFQKSE